MNISLDLLKKLREETKSGVSDCRAALEETNGDYEKAKAFLNEKNKEKAKKKEGNAASEGIIASYVHSNNKVGVLIEIRCETDFVAKTDDFKTLAKELTLQIAAMEPKNVEELLKSPYIRDTKQTIGDLVKLTIGKLGENIIVARFTRLALGEE
jgi:elongation factor Ts